MGVECDIDELKHQAWLRVEDAMERPEKWVGCHHWTWRISGILEKEKGIKITSLSQYSEGYSVHLNEVTIKTIHKSERAEDGIEDWESENPSPLIDTITGLPLKSATKSVIKKYEQWLNLRDAEYDRLVAEDNKENKESGYNKVDAFFKGVVASIRKAEECRQLEAALNQKKDECKKLEKELGVSTPQPENTPDVETAPQQEGVVDSGSENRVRLPWYKRLFN